MAKIKISTKDFSDGSLKDIKDAIVKTAGEEVAVAMLKHEESQEKKFIEQSTKIEILENEVSRLESEISSFHDTSLVHFKKTLEIYGKTANNLIVLFVVFAFVVIGINFYLKTLS